MKVLKKTKDNFTKLLKSTNLFYKFILHGPPLIALVVGILYVSIVLVNFNKDTTPIVNATLAIVSVLSGLAFGASASVKDANAKQRFAYSGERFFHAALLLIMASILKYSILTIQNFSLLKEHPSLIPVLTIPLGTLFQACFMFAVLLAHTALRITNKELWHRVAKQDDWDDVL